MSEDPEACAVCGLPSTTRTLIERLHAWLETFSDEMRLHVFKLITEGFCRYCGSQLSKDRPHCYCRNDD